MTLETDTVLLSKYGTTIHVVEMRAASIEVFIEASWNDQPAYHSGRRGYFSSFPRHVVEKHLAEGYYQEKK